MFTRESPLWPADREGKVLINGLFGTWSQKWTAAHVAPFWCSTVRALRGSPPSGKSFKWYTWPFTFCGHRSSPREEYAETHGQWWVTWLIWQGPGKRRIGILGTWESRVEADGWSYGSGHKVWRSLYHMLSAHQKAFTIEKAGNIQVSRKTWPVNISQPLSSATLVLSQWVYRRNI